MGFTAIASLILQLVPEAADAFVKIRATMSETDQATLDAERAAGDAAVTSEHDALKALLAG